MTTRLATNRTMKQVFSMDTMPPSASPTVVGPKRTTTIGPVQMHWAWTMRILNVSLLAKSRCYKPKLAHSFCWWLTHMPHTRITDRRRRFGE